MNQDLCPMCMQRDRYYTNIVASVQSVSVDMNVFTLQEQYVFPLYGTDGSVTASRIGFLYVGEPAAFDGGVGMVEGYTTSLTGDLFGFKIPFGADLLTVFPAAAVLFKEARGGK